MQLLLNDNRFKPNLMLMLPIITQLRTCLRIIRLRQHNKDGTIVLSNHKKDYQTIRRITKTKRTRIKNRVTVKRKNKRN